MIRRENELNFSGLLYTDLFILQDYQHKQNTRSGYHATRLYHTHNQAEPDL